MPLFADDDGLRRKYVALLTQLEAQSNPARQTGTLCVPVAEALSTWAAQRDGEARAEVLMALSNLYTAAGERQQAFVALAAAAESHPQPFNLIEQTIRVATDLEMWPEALHWLWRAAEQAPKPLALQVAGTQVGEGDTSAKHQADHYLRQIIAIASHQQRDTEMVRRALAALSQRTRDELSQLVNLACNSDTYDDLVSPSLLATCTAPQLLRCARSLIEVPRLAVAQRLLQALLERAEVAPEHVAAAWKLAETAWREHHQIADLAHWRLRWAPHAAPQEALRLRLLGYTELLEAGVAPNNAKVRLAQALLEVDVSDLAGAQAAFTAAQAIDEERSLDRAARALQRFAAEKRCGGARGAAGKVMKHELAMGDAQQAVALAQQLVDLDDASGPGYLEAALIKAGAS